MKFLVDSLPYYHEDCPFIGDIKCQMSDCPQYWDKEFVTSENNPHECAWLKEQVRTRSLKYDKTNNDDGIATISFSKEAE